MKYLFSTFLAALAVFVVFAGANAQTCIPPPSGMVSWWDGDAISGLTAWDIQDGNDGTLKNGASTAPGIVGQAFSFDGVDDYVEVPDSPNLDITRALTVDAWVQPEVESLSGNRAIATKEGWDELGRITGIVLNVIDGQPELAVETTAGWEGPCRADSPLQAGVFTHLAGTYDGSAVRFYVNGALAKTCPRTGLMTTNGLNLSIGARASSNSRFFKGLVDELEIFNRALSGLEIQAIFQAGRAGKCKWGEYIDLASLPDINGNLSPEIAALLKLPDGQPQVIIKDSDTKAFIAEMDFGNPNQTAKGVTGLLDITGNGAPEVAVLLTRQDGVSVVQMRDSKTGRWIDKMRFFGPEWETKAVTSQDLDLDGVSEVSVLGVSKDGTKAATQIRDSVTKETLNWIGWPVE